MVDITEAENAAIKKRVEAIADRVWKATYTPTSPHSSGPPGAELFHRGQAAETSRALHHVSPTSTRSHHSEESTSDIGASSSRKVPDGTMKKEEVKPLVPAATDESCTAASDACTGAGLDGPSAIAGNRCEPGATG